MNHPAQPPLFVESIYDALKAVVAALGGPMTVGIILWPAKSAADARKQLLDCLNPERNDKLDPEQIVLLLRLAREADFHLAKHWLDGETGYLPSAPADPANEEAKQIAMIDNAAQQLQRAFVALDKLRNRKPLTKVVG